MNQNLNIHLKPWIGSNYQSSKEKILLLGESNYDTDGNYKDVGEEFSIEIVQEFLDGENYKLYKNAGLLFNKECRQIWNSIAFSNIFQTPFSNSKAQPSEDDKKEIPANFESLLNILKPSKVIVLSRRLWEWLPEKNGREIDSIQEGKRHSSVWKYDYENGSCLVIGICHPSRMNQRNGTIDEWSSVVNSFLVE